MSAYVVDFSAFPGLAHTRGVGDRIPVVAWVDELSLTGVRHDDRIQAQLGAGACFVWIPATEITRRMDWAPGLEAGR